MYLLRWERAGAGRGACSAGIHQRGKRSFLNPSALCLECATLQWQVLTLLSLHTRAISHGLRLFSKRPSQSSTVVTVPSTRWLSPPSRGTRPCFQTSSSSSSGLAFCSSWVEEKFSRGQRRKPSVLVPSDGKSCHWVVIAFCLSFSHPKQPSVSLLKRNSLCNLKDDTNVFTFGLFCSVLNAKGVSHKQANGSIFLKSVLKL